MLHLTNKTIATILSLYRRHKIRNVRAIHAILSLHNPSLAAYPHNTDANSFETEHLQDVIPPKQYMKIVAIAGITRKCRDRVPSDKEKIIEVLNREKCRDYVDEVLTKEEVRMLRGMGVKILGRFEGRDSVVEVDGDKDMEARNEELGLHTPACDKKVIVIGNSPSGLMLQTPGRDKEVILIGSSPSGLGLQTPGRDEKEVIVIGSSPRLHTPGADKEVILIESSPSELALGAPTPDNGAGDSSPSEGGQIHSDFMNSRVAYLRSEAAAQDWAQQQTGRSEGASAETPISLIDPMILED